MISVGFTPGFVQVMDPSGSSGTYGGISTTGNNDGGVELTAGGFLAKNADGSQCNYASPEYSLYRTYIYVAIE